MTAQRPPPRVACPHCGHRQPWDPNNPWRPFCSERCRLIDLGAWLDEKHAIPGDQAPPVPDADSD